MCGRQHKWQKLPISKRCLEKRLPCQLQKYSVLIKWIDFQMNTISSCNCWTIVKLKVCSRCRKYENQTINDSLNAVQFWAQIYLIAAWNCAHFNINWYEKWLCFFLFMARINVYLAVICPQHRWICNFCAEAMGFWSVFCFVPWHRWAASGWVFSVLHFALDSVILPQINEQANTIR